MIIYSILVYVWEITLSIVRAINASPLKTTVMIDILGLSDKSEISPAILINFMGLSSKKTPVSAGVS
jgi:hypothetical protein